MDRQTVTLNISNDIEKHGINNDPRRSTSNLECDEGNDALLYSDSESSTSSCSTSYHKIQNSVKIPPEMKNSTIYQKLSDSEDSEIKNAKETDAKLNDQKLLEVFSELSDDEDRNSDEQNRSYSSLEGLSSLSNELDLDVIDMENLMSDNGSSKSAFSFNKLISTLPADDKVFYSHLPPINRDTNATVPLQIIDKNFEEKVLFISDIFDPAHFWFQLVEGDERFEFFEKFDEKLDSDYQKLNKNELMISEENFKEGLIVAAYVNKFKRWHRAKIVDTYKNEKSFVRLFFIDYGTSWTCSKKNIRYLFQYFLKYPQYCFRGRVHGVVPLNNKRSFELNHIEEFIAKVANCSFTAEVVKYEPEEDVYQLNLVRRKGKVNIKDYLLEKKFCDEINPSHNDSELSIGPQCYLIPTFEALERDYPTIGGLEKMKRSGIDYNLVIDTNHFHSVRREDVEKDVELQIIVKSQQFSLAKHYFYGYT